MAKRKLQNGKIQPPSDNNVCPLPIITMSSTQTYKHFTESFEVSTFMILYSN